MKRKFKIQIEEILNTMSDAEIELEQMISDKNETVLSVVADLQDTAIQIGNVIEESEGSGHICIGLIEKYCEALWKLYEKLSNGEYDSINQYRDTLNCLANVRTTVANEIKVRKEVVFLPYNASMWDSLESVWRAACEDDECDAYVIPIPYYDKNQDGSFGEMHYEGDRFPDYVPITHFDNYSLEQNHPDVIFIHNPYDDCNVVTSVHPYFYSKKIKNFTDNLVYIPYFVLEEINPDSEMLVKRVEHFCLLPGVIHADKVILQSEQMKQVYIKNLVEYAGENTRKIWEEKLLGIGSPKFDKVENIQKDKMEISSEWWEIIHKADGSRKKVILYNTSIKSLMTYEDRMIDKIQQVFVTFKNNIDKVALWWRPHPLFKATIKSMKPELQSAYNELVEKYISEGWGIYDESPDLDRAVVMCDGYYGDLSSVVQLCLKVNKPVMIQTIE